MTHLPTEPERFTIEGLTLLLSSRARALLQVEMDDWARRASHIKPDEDRLRYIFMSVLQRLGEDCPHPYRLPLLQPGRLASECKSFECRMCRVWFFHRDEYDGRPNGTITRKETPDGQP